MYFKTPKKIIYISIIILLSFFWEKFGNLKNYTYLCIGKLKVHRYYKSRLKIYVY